MPDPAPTVPPPAAAWAELPGRSALRVQGPDAVRFVDRFTTAAVTGLAVGTGSEGFFTDAAGHVLALVNLLRTPDGLWIDAPAGVAGPLRAHLEHYLIRERVEFRDATAERGTLLLVGPRAAAWLTAQAAGPLPTSLLGHGRIVLGGVEAEAVALDWFGPGGLLVQAPAEDVGRLAAWLRAAGLPDIDAATVDALRIAAGSPEPRDLDARTLPQELGRDSRAISFTKGCYLGQETVARLDALGHVNRRFVLLGTAAPPVPGGAVSASGAAVGRITSGCAAFGTGGLGLALVHVRGLAGGPLEVDGSPARVLPARNGSATETA